jgi:outer membrane protein
MSNRLRARLLAAACGLGLIGAAAHAETLADAITLAYQTNPTLQAQRASQRALDETVVQAKSAFRPSVSATLDASNTDVEGPLDRKTSSGTLNVTQNLYTGGRATWQLSAAEADVLAGQQNVRRVESSVLLSTITAYVDVRRYLESLRISQDNVDRLRKQLDEAQARFDVGDVTRTDVAQAQARYAAAQAGLSNAQANLGIARATYAAVIGQTPGELAQEPSLANLLPVSVDQAFTAAEANNPQIMSAEFTEQASRARVAQARAATRPTVSLRGQLGYSAAQQGVQGDQFRDYSKSVTTEVTATVPIFTGGLTSSSIRQQIERNNTDRLSLENTRRTVVQSVTQAWNQLLGARAGLVSNEEQVRATRLAYEGVQQEQQVGLRTTIDVLNAEAELQSAELALVGSRRDEYVAAALVLQAMGVLEVDKLVPTVPRYDAVGHSKRISNTLVGYAPTEPVVRVIDKVGAPFESKGPADAPVATAPVTVTEPDPLPPDPKGPGPLPVIPEIETPPPAATPAPAGRVAPAARATPAPSAR